MKIDFRARCKCCGKFPRGKARIAEFARYAPFCSYHCQETYNMKINLQYCAELRARQGESHE